MAKEAVDNHNDIDLGDMEWVSDTEDEKASESSLFDPIIDGFKVGLLYEIFVDSLKAASPAAAEKFFDAKCPCTLVLRCASTDEVDIFGVGIEEVLADGMRQRYRGPHPAKSILVYLEQYAYDSKKTSKALLSRLFEHRRVFILATNDHAIPDEVGRFVDADIQIRCSPTALEAAVQKYIKSDFWLDAKIGDELMAVPLQQLMNIFSKGRDPLHSFELAFAWLEAAKRGEQTDVKPALDTDEPTLDDLHGLGAAGEWGRDLARDLEDWQAGRISWSEVDRGVLLYGPPGTGKTTFASALARTCDVALVSTSMSQWQAKGHLGDYLKAMRKAFEEAQKQAPCILFIDEFDSAGDRNSATSDSDGSDYIRRAVNGLLECLDGAAGREGVIVVGATNYPEKIDAALRRPGRLDKLVEIPLPDAAARDGILRFHLKGDLESVDLTPVVELTEGMAGAWLEGLVRDARRTARRQRRDVEIDDLLNALPRRVAMSPQNLERAAIHEAGHAIVALELGKQVVRAEVRREVIEGVDSQFGGFVAVRVTESERHVMTSSQILDTVKQLLGGLAAEDIFFEERSDTGTYDLRVATHWLARMYLCTGQSGSLTYLSDPDNALTALRLYPDIRKQVEESLQNSMREATVIIERRRSDVRRLADALQAHENLSGEQINGLLNLKRRGIRLLKSMHEREEFENAGSRYEYA